MSHRFLSRVAQLFRDVVTPLHYVMENDLCTDRQTDRQIDRQTDRQTDYLRRARATKNVNIVQPSGKFFNEKLVR